MVEKEKYIKFKDLHCTLVDAAQNMHVVFLVYNEAELFACCWFLAILAGCLFLSAQCSLPFTF